MSVTEESEVSDLNSFHDEYIYHSLLSPVPPSFTSSLFPNFRSAFAFLLLFHVVIYSPTHSPSTFSHIPVITSIMYFLKLLSIQAL